MFGSISTTAAEQTTEKKQTLEAFRRMLFPGLEGSGDTAYEKLEDPKPIGRKVITKTGCQMGNSYTDNEITSWT